MSPATAAKNDDPTAPHQGMRETVESIVVAFILAFLFRSFVAEAFVIPTGSMAPTLMGAHKDLICDHCGQSYQANASREFDELGARTGVTAIASTCSVCRGVNEYDPGNDSNEQTFSGDRILVSKFDYVLSDPKRWDVFVFKFPEKARMNYIKRLVGLPGEQLLIREGDVYINHPQNEEWDIARKPPHKIRAMRQIVSDTRHLPGELVKQGWPSPWQPWDPAGDPGGWKVEQTEESWTAELASSQSPVRLRYFHKYLDASEWLKIEQGDPLGPVDPTASQLVTDYLAYNSTFESTSNNIAARPNLIASEVARIARDQRNSNGVHWVGDLLGEYVVDVQSDNGSLLVDLVEFGIRFQLSIDVASGNATLFAEDASLEGGPVKLEGFFGGSTELTASTNVQGKGSYRIEMGNIDDQIVVWINGSLVEFNQPSLFNSRSVRTGEARRPYWLASDPLDAAPLGIGGQGIAMRVEQAAVYRDLYYIAVQPLSFDDFGGNIRPSLLAELPPDAKSAENGDYFDIIAEIYSNPQWWSETNLFALRGELQFQLEDDHYFPMGDNSAASSDARVWSGGNFVEHKFLLGKALLVFWPHYWNSPVPFTPNFKRMGLIR